MSSTTTTEGWADRADLQVAIVITAIWMALMITITWNNFPQDLSAIYFASWFFADGQPEMVYAAPEGFFGKTNVPEWLALMETFGFGDEISFAYVYPPVWAAAIGPIAKSLDPTTFFNAVYVMHISMIAAMVWLWHRMAGVRMPTAVWVTISFAICITSNIVVVALLHNQPQITVSFLVVFALERYMSGRQAQAGVLLGLAAAIKITPILIAFIFLFDGGRRAFWVSGATAAGIAALSFLVAGPDLHWQFLETLSVVSSKTALMNVNYNLELFFYELAHAISGDPENLARAADGGFKNKAIDEPVWLRFLVLGCLALGLYVIYRFTGGIPRQDRLLLQFAALWLVTTLCAPLGWNHHYLPIILMAPLYLRYMSGRGLVVFLTILLVVSHRAVFSLLAERIDKVHGPAIVGVLAALALLYVTMRAAKKLQTGAMST